jgi:hypothetical protein
MSPQRTERAGRALAAVVALGALAGGCSDIYYDRRETIALGADDAVAANIASAVVDPWPWQSNNNNLTFAGDRMQRAVECYRNNRVTPPTDLNPSTSTAVAPQTNNQACQGQMGQNGPGGGMGMVNAQPGNPGAAIAAAAK